VLISTATATHAPLVLRALELGYVSEARCTKSPGVDVDSAHHGREAHCGRCRHDATGRAGRQREAAPQVPRSLLQTLCV
jgi:hypothetical protein